MKEFQGLLLNFSQAGGVGSALRAIWESSPTLSAVLHCESVEANDADFCAEFLPKVVAGCDPDLILLVLAEGLSERTCELFRLLKGAAPDTPVIVVAEITEPDQMVRLLELGATDFITTPLKDIDIIPRIWRLFQRAPKERASAQTLKEKLGLKRLVGQSPSFLAEVKKIPLLAKCDASVMILGETGTGKELCARALHYLGTRSSKPMVSVNCGAIPEQLMESELFGHERGAFTGAAASRHGLVREAEGGTLFLDEVDCLPPAMQVKLLRFIQEKEYRSLGSAKVFKADVRIISATNTSIEEAVRRGRLRQDLYFRLNVIPLRLPPLRERREDIPLLARHFLDKYGADFGKGVAGFSQRAMQSLMLYDWPGNVRELEHIVERAVALSERSLIDEVDITLAAELATPEESFREAKGRFVTDFERKYIQQLLAAHHGNITKASQAAKKNRRAFWQLIRKHKIDLRNFKPDVSRA